MFLFENDLCPKKFYSSGGFEGKKPSIKTLELTQPNGGEVFLAGTDTIITWEGVPPNEPVKIEYSIDNGLNWIIASHYLTGFNYTWHVPKTPSNQCLARVTARASLDSYCDNPDVEICGKIWMGCNLDIETYRNGDSIRQVFSDGEWRDAYYNGEGVWCYYNNNDSLGQIYWKLYNWHAVNDPRGLAPGGWHVASDSEWIELENCLGGRSVAGGKLKITGTLEGGDGLWYSQNTGATNEVGFSALPGGFHDSSSGYGFLGEEGRWWTSTESSKGAGLFVKLGHNYNFITHGGNIGSYGYSVRCIRD
jgi:uncharacterized protein (TIGR02145 family)